MQDETSSKKPLTSKETRDLDIEISFLEGLIRRAPSYIEALQLLGDDYTRRGRYQDGLNVDERLVSLCPRDSMVHYNLACSFSLTECLEESLAALETAINLGYNDFKWLNEDSDLENVRNHPGFQIILQSISEKQAE